MTSLYEVLKRSKTAPQLAPDMFTALWAKSITAGKTIELSGQVPLSFKANGAPLIDYTISGNMEQSGTPTPDNPIMPQGIGERTGNLLPEFYATSGEISGNSYTITKNSIETHNDGSVLGAYYVLTEFSRYGNYANYTKIDEKHSFKIPAGTYTFSANENIYNCNNGLRLIVGQLGQAVAGATGGAKNIGVGQTFTINEDSYVCPVLEIRYDSCVDEYILTNPMLNTGSTAIPYEPYGIKIPISSAGQTNNIYLGEVQTTRKIRKLVLTGGEDWVKASTPTGWHTYRLAVEGYLRANANVPFCTHFYGIAPVTGSSLVEDLQTAFLISESGNNYYYIRDDNIETLADFKAFLAAQYANGTPVTVWYVLATETAGIVNEPLCKIGTYADTLSKSQAGVNIPTSDGSTTLDVLAAVKPSNVSIKYRV